MGYMELTTQMYFSREKLNDTDRILQKHTPVEIAELIAKKTSEDLLTYTFRIVLEKMIIHSVAYAGIFSEKGCVYL